MANHLIFEEGGGAFLKKNISCKPSSQEKILQQLVDSVLYQKKLLHAVGLEKIPAH